SFCSYKGSWKSQRTLTVQEDFCPIRQRDCILPPFWCGQLIINQCCHGTCIWLEQQFTVFISKYTLVGNFKGRDRIAKCNSLTIGKRQYCFVSSRFYFLILRYELQFFHRPILQKYRRYSNDHQHHRCYGNQSPREYTFDGCFLYFIMNGLVG